MNITYHMPTQVIDGANCITTEAARFQSLGTHALLVTGARSARLSGALDDVINALQACQIGWTLFQEVEENPSIETVRRAAVIGRNAGADFVIGIGGGSPMDAAKAIAVLLVADLDDTAMFSGTYPDNTAPIVCVPTTSGTGSEVTPYAILTDHAQQLKRNMGGPRMFPRLAFLDARYTLTLPWSFTLHTALDALSHAVEGWLAVRGNALSAPFAETGMRMMMDVLGEMADLHAAGTDAGDIPLSLRTQAMRGAMFGGITIAQTGTTLLHAMGYCLTLRHGLGHGHANGVLMPVYFRMLAAKMPERMDAMAALMGFPDMEACCRFLTELPVPGILLDPEEAGICATIAAAAKNAANTPAVFTTGELTEAYLACHR